jgi:hypothetical protein
VRVERTEDRRAGIVEAMELGRPVGRGADDAAAMAAEPIPEAGAIRPDERLPEQRPHRGADDRGVEGVDPGPDQYEPGAADGLRGPDQICVNCTLLSAANRDYRVTAVTDGVASPWPELQEACFEIWRRKFARLRTTEEVVAEIHGTSSPGRRGWPRKSPCGLGPCDRRAENRSARRAS